MLAAVVLITLPVAPPSPAATCDGSTREMNDCAGKLLIKANARLSRLVNELNKQAAGNAHYSDGLKASSVAWEKYRDAQCKFQSLEFDGGSAQTFSELLCRFNLALARTKELQPR